MDEFRAHDLLRVPRVFMNVMESPQMGASDMLFRLIARCFSTERHPARVLTTGHSRRNDRTCALDGCRDRPRCGYVRPGSPAPSDGASCADLAGATRGEVLPAFPAQVSATSLPPLERAGADHRRPLFSHGLASSTRLNGDCVARRNRVKPARVITDRILASPACAPSASPTSCESEQGVQIRVEAA